MTLEDLILGHDHRGIARLRPHLPVGYCEAAARLLLGCEGLVLVATGFYILKAGKPETDGPPGALVLGRALEALGRRVLYVTDAPCAGLMRALAGPDAVVDFPIADEPASERYARELIGHLQPRLLVAIERCGQTADGRYLNWGGQDISAWTARLDPLFRLGLPSLAIGDGGNEIGMGSLATEIPRYPGLPARPCVTPATAVVLASVSNWGGYGVVAALSRLVGQRLLPGVEDERILRERTAALGAVDGASGEHISAVDGIDPETNSRVVASLHSWLAAS